jgi:hypothetical protein
VKNRANQKGQQPEAAQHSFDFVKNPPDSRNRRSTSRKKSTEPGEPQRSEPPQASFDFTWVSK